MNRSLAAIIVLMTLSMQTTQAQKRSVTDVSLSPLFAPPHKCLTGKQCVVLVEVVAPQNGNNCQAKFPIEIHIPRDSVGMRLVWKLNPSSGSGLYKFDSNYGVEILNDPDRQMLAGAPLSDVEWYAVGRNSVSLATADYLPHVLRAENLASKFVPCDVVDPRIIND